MSLENAIKSLTEEIRLLRDHIQNGNFALDKQHAPKKETKKKVETPYVAHGKDSPTSNAKTDKEVEKQVEEADQSQPVSFENDLVPAFKRMAAEAPNKCRQLLAHYKLNKLSDATEDQYTSILNVLKNPDAWPGIFKAEG